ncbi:hypothetical protein PIB30_009654 [Stylosanthes scabra]|uniref:Uncharacterized protein n=1 Tax=Stylosanthes scabra TaxID=79078 RepID=A0ABU6T567_9FABA|nr:hypothetical protein [Stylosanthes scabra]
MRCIPMITASPRLDELSPKRNKPPHGGEVHPCLRILGIHNCEDTDPAIDSRPQLMHQGTKLNPCREALTVVGRGVRIAVADLTMFLPILPMGDRHLRSFAHFNPQPRHYGKLLATRNHNCGK